MGYNEQYFQNQIRKSDDKVAWQYGSMVSFAHTEPPTALRVLDAGCGAGPGLRYLCSRGYCTFGTDFVEYPLIVSRQVAPGASIARSDLGKPFPFAAEAFDLILMGEVIEHLDDTHALLAECRRVLATGGALVVTTPNLRDIRKYWQGRQWSGYIDPTHKRLFNAAGLAAEFRAAGFNRVRVRTGFKPMFWVSSKKLGLRFAVPWPPLIGNTLIAVGYRD
ncbi:MAG: methyltransferase domain-containing protein [Anaerolineae bacterium]